MSITPEFLITDINQPLRKFLYPFTGTEKVQLKKAKRLREIFATIIEERKTGNESHADLLDMLLNSRYEDTGEAMTNDQLVNEVLIIVFAGHETTANTLSWMLYLLSANENVLQKLIGSFTSSISENLKNEYLKAIIYEAMRLYPAAGMTEREALTDDAFNGFSYPEKTILIPFFLGLHRDKKYWNDELQFQPERFITDPKLAKSKYFFPFGAGPRMCIGNNFAMAEMSLFLFSFLQKFRITPTGQIPNMKALITLQPDKVLLNIKPYNNL